ncbi:MAG: glycerol-3-phosphate acyltransferase, partial [Hydrogenophaga sp.]|nr:glycerol-3-phosphate acyltransferase [Hydrogenophaga sp.]
VKWWGDAWGLGDGTVALVGLAAFLGHLYPVFFRFQGGKGVATAAGVILGFNPWLGLATLATWVIVAFFFRYSSLASIVTAVFAPAYYLFGRQVAWDAPNVMVLSLAVMGILLVWRHAENINRLFAGKESKLGSKSK